MPLENTRKIAWCFLISASALVLGLSFGLDYSRLVVLALIAFIISGHLMGFLSPLAFALLPIGVLPIFNVLPADIVSKFYLNPLIFYFVGILIVLVALQKYNFHRWIVANLLIITRRQPRVFISSMIILTGILSITVTGMGAIWILSPVLVILNSSFIKSFTQEEAQEATKSLIFGVTTMAVAMGLASPIGSVGAMILFGLVPQLSGDLRIGVIEWIIQFSPVTLLLMVLIPFLSTWVLFKVPKTPIKEECIAITETKLSREAGWIFGLVAVMSVCLFIGDLGIIGGQSDYTAGYIHPASFLSTAAMALLLLPRTRGEQLLNDNDIKNMPWAPLLVIAGGLALADSVVSTGLGQESFDYFYRLFYDLPILYYLIAFACAFILSELIGQDLAAILLLPVFGTFALRYELPVVPMLIAVGLATCTTLMSSKSVNYFPLLFPSSNFRPRERIWIAFFVKVLLAVIFVSYLLIFVLPSQS